MPAASILIKPASANCNMDCKYCFYKVLSSNREEYNKGFMSYETLETLVREAIRYADGFLSFAFQGGEPTLIGIDFYKKALEIQHKYNDKQLVIENTIQTNGYRIDEEWAKFLHDSNFLVGLSIDGPKKVHDQYRVDYAGRGTFAQLMHTVELFRQYDVRFNILTVVTESLTGKANYLYRFYQKNAFEYVQLIPCMDEKNRVRKADGAQAECPVTAKSYGKFLCELFDLWYEDFMKGQQMDIRMFSNLAQMAAGYPPEECGMKGCCSCYFVVEGDGSVYPCDFYCQDDWKLGKVGDSFSDMLQSAKVQHFIDVSKKLPEKCRSCKYLALCHGGCRRWREDGMSGKLGLNQLCEAYEIFFAHTWQRIERLGQMIVDRYGVYHGNP